MAAACGSASTRRDPGPPPSVQRDEHERAAKGQRQKAEKPQDPEAAKRAEQAIGRNHPVEAATEKRNQLLNHYAARAAHDARDEVRAGTAYLDIDAEQPGRPLVDHQLEARWLFDRDGARWLAAQHPCGDRADPFARHVGQHRGEPVKTARWFAMRSMQPRHLDWNCGAHS